MKRNIYRDIYVGEEKRGGEERRRRGEREWLLYVFCMLLHQ